MKLAYADPPYVGRSSYYDHDNRKYWDDPAAHVALILELQNQYDGWAMSCSVPTLFALLPHAEGARVGAWTKSWCAGRRGVRVAYTWEPVIFKTARKTYTDGAPPVRDSLRTPMAMQTGLVGAKPPAFCRWVLDLMGYVQGDVVVDVFPGTGVMDRVVSQGQLELWANATTD